MLKVFVIVWTLVIALIWWAMPVKAMEYSIGVAAGYNQGVLGDKTGLGTADDTTYPLSVFARAIYPMKYANPVVELSYKQSRYDVNTSVANIHLEPMELSARIGLTKNIYGFEVIGLVGYTHIEGNLYVVQNAGNGVWFSHSNHADGLTNGNIFDIATLKIGMAKYLPLYKKINIGVEVGAELYPFSRKIDRCLTFDSNFVEPYAALQIKF
jgi:hypothetical protein